MYMPQVMVALVSTGPFFSAFSIIIIYFSNIGNLLLLFFSNICIVSNCNHQLLTADEKSINIKLVTSFRQIVSEPAFFCHASKLPNSPFQ